jgi:hypothetical protein
MAIGGALEFLDTLNTTIELSECEATHRWDGAGRIRVECDYRLGSDFLSAMGPSWLSGQLSAIVAEGAVVSVLAPGAMDHWQALDSWIRDSDPAAAEAIFGSGEPGGVSPPPDASLAEALLAAAESVRSGFLQPGETIETTTPAGTIVWTLQDPFDQRPAFWLRAVAGTFWALADGGPGTPESDIRLLRSEDGLQWEQVGGRPPGFWGEPMVFDDRLVVSAQGADGIPVLSEWDGDRWVDIEVDPFPEEGDWWLHSVAESSGRVLLIAEGWDPNGDRRLGSLVWALTQSGRFELLTLDGPDLSAAGFARLAGWEGGFALLLEAGDGGAAPAAEVWTSPDGVEWELAVDELPLQGSVEWLGPMGDGLAVRAYAGDECEQVAGGSRCHPIWELWRSADGARWERGPAVDLGGYFDVASGPLGTLAVTSGDAWWDPQGLPVEPISVLMAPEEGPFEELTDLRIGSPFVEFYWIGDVEMTADTVVVSVSGVSGIDAGPLERIEQQWLLVGRLVAS